MAKLTARAIELAKAKDKAYKLVDGEGLQLRIAVDGTKTWLVRYVVDGKTRQYSLPESYRADGGAGFMTLQGAREAARAIRTLAKTGVDYHEQLERNVAALEAEHKAKLLAAQIAEDEANRAREAHEARLTIGALLDRWERIELKARKDGGAEVRRSFEKDVLPTLGEVAAIDVTRSMIAAVLDTIVERGAPIVARNLLGDLRQMASFAIKRGILENDPTSHLKRNDYGTKNERDRVLSDAEIKELQDKLPTAKLQASTEIALWLMLSTCCRVGEISRARWEDVAIDAGTWRIPPDNAKNGKAHTVLLSDFSIQQFKKLHAISGKTAWCYPAENKDDQHVCLKSISKQIHDRQRTVPMKNRSKATGALLLAGGEWTPHDLRRTGATIMGGLGVRPDVVEKVLNHVEQNKLIRIYQRQELKAEQQEAWRLLGERLDLLTSGAVNVITMQRSAARA
ncbi:tyrosine-type recombinase/integrase [Rhodoferax sp.]|uniref:tyrosine-type recombinase/integrase n=1 Tax=Rhodoferax sp. TaxID=50421 RepID=UPI00283C437D|nr:tyrosine-type recombinase/integrase [Rhodoferax sp.]MDR3371206.1 tyrosine-type recombinase/integrase [Rhodoferax sp.]